MVRSILGVILGDLAMFLIVMGGLTVAYLALTFDYSVALGAFLAGSLIAESGHEREIEHLIVPVRDVFAAIFFVSVMPPVQITSGWRGAVATSWSEMLVSNCTAKGIGRPGWTNDWKR